MILAANRTREVLQDTEHGNQPDLTSGRETTAEPVELCFLHLCATAGVDEAGPG